MSLDLEHGAGYGSTLTWSERDRPTVSLPPVEVQMDVDTAQFYGIFVKLMIAPTRSPQ